MKLLPRHHSPHGLVYPKRFEIRCPTVSFVRLRRSWPLGLLVLAVLAYTIVFSYITLTRYAAFEARALDMGNLHQTVWNTAQGRLFQMTNQPGIVNRLSLHVEPILLPIALLYWLHDGPETLLIFQALVVALGALPLFALAKHKLQNEWLALFFALAFLLNPSIQGANWLEFHPVTLAPTFLLAAFYFLIAGRAGWYAFFAILAASCKEEIGLLLFMIGFYALIWLRQRRLGLVTMGLALAWSLIAVLGIQQVFANGNIHWGRYEYLGATPVEKLLALLTQPGVVLVQLQRAETWRYLYEALQPVGFTALLAPEILLLALPSLAINLLADFPPMHQVYELIYIAPVVPFVMLASVMGVARLQRLLAGQAQRRQTLVGTALLILVLGGALYTQRAAGYLPGGGNYRHFTVTDHHRAAAAIIAQIPATAKVSAQDRLDPHVAGRETIYIFPRVDDADTILLDVTGPAWPQHPNDLYTSVQDLLHSGFGVAAADDGYLLLQKGSANSQLPAAFYRAFRRPEHQPLVDPAPALRFADQLQLIDYRVMTDVHGELVVQLYWQAHQSLTADYRFYLAYHDTAGNLLHDTQFYQPVATLWYPTSAWTHGETVLVQSLPWQMSADDFGLSIGIYRDEDGWSTGKRLALTTPPILGYPHLEQNTLVRLGGYTWQRERWVPITPPAKAPSQPLAVAVGAGLLTLAGVDVTTIPTQVGEPFAFTLYWQTGNQKPDFDYALFAQLFDSAGNKVVQVDWQPRDHIGLRPMTTWLPGEALQDSQTLPLPTPLAAGTYKVLIGVYNWQNGDRLKVAGDATEAGDSIVIGTFEIK